MGQIAYLAKQGGDAVFNTVFVGRLIAQAGTTLRGNLVVSGSITAQSLIVSTTSVYSGSTRFGEIITNTHQFTGSILNSGSITTIGSVTAASFVGSGASLTSIPNSALNNSTISGIALGSNLANLTVDDSSLQLNSTTTYNGNAARTISVKALGITNAMLAGSIANAKLTNSTISGIALGSNLATLTIGTGLSGTSYNGSGAVTIACTITNTNQLTNGAGFITSAGNAATATALSSGQTNWSGTGVLGNVVGLLAWKNYGNSHVIFDASNSTSPSGGAVNDTNATNAWTATYPTLMGWNGSGTYGVRVDSARVADSAGNATTAGGLAVHTGRNNEADKIVRTQANGYILCGYINSSNGNENNNSNPDRVWGTNGSDDYLRTYRTSALSVSYAATAGSAPANGGTAAAVNQTVAADTNANLVYSQMGSNDFFRIRVGGASNAGYAEIATADDGTEPIYVRQYTGVFSDVTRTATLLDGSGNTSFPGNISGGYILGSYFNASAGNSENPSIGQIWTQNTTDNYLRKSTPAHLISQLGLITTGNYSSYALPLGGGTISGNVTINGSSNTVLTLSASEPHIRIAATGGSNVAGVVIVPTSGYDAFVGNFNNGATNIMANSVKIGQFRKDTYFTPNDGNNDLRMGDGTSSTQGSISLYGSNSGAGYEGRLNCLNNDGNTHFYHRNNSAIFSDVGYFNQSGFYIDVLGGPSDIRLKDVIETNPSSSVDNIDVIKYTFKSNPSLTRYGYSAQQVQSVLPDLVTVNSPISGSADEGTLMLNYNDLHVLKIAALERKVADLQSQINDLKSK